MWRCPDQLSVDKRGAGNRPTYCRVQHQGARSCFCQTTTSYGASIVSKSAYLKAATFDQTARAPSAAGPYRVVEAVENRYIRLELHEGYWGGRPAPKGNRVSDGAGAGGTRRRPSRWRLRCHPDRSAGRPGQAWLEATHVLPHAVLSFDRQRGAAGSGASGAP
ncbi:hypothetical protein EAV90_27510 [Bradyrhizobium vignae]|nr:hypothetical protein EAV90_27510 [Bradyrhizobium vignae]